MKDLSECRVLVVDDVKSNVDVRVHALRDDLTVVAVRRTPAVPEG